MMRTFSQYTRTEKLMFSLSLAVCVYFSVTFLLVVLGNFWPGPLFDYWVDIPLLEKYFSQQLTFTDLITAHNNAHRILIPRLLFILDYRYFAGTNILLVSVSMLCKLFTILLFTHLLKEQSLRTRLVLTALMFAAVLNAGNIYNVIFNFDIQWDLVSVFACFAIFFYTKTLQAKNHWHDRWLAYLFLSLAFLSHAGALSLPLVFIIISTLNKKLIETLLNFLLAFAVYFIHSQLPFADPNNPDVQTALIMLILHPVAVALFITKFASGALIFYMGAGGYYFSAYILLLLTGGVVLAIKNRNLQNACCHNVFLYFSLFLFLMIATIAAARTLFTPNVWAASRFQTTALLFLLCIHIHAWLAAAEFFKNKTKVFALPAIALHGFSIFFLIHYFTYNIPYKLSNVVFFSHAYMLTHDRNQNNAPRLLLWIHDEDVIANSEAFFRKNGFAWYANKQSPADTGSDFIDTGKVLIVAGKMPAFAQSCKQRVSRPVYLNTQEGGIEFSTPIRTPFHRTTYYALDASGVVVGFAYVFTSESGFVKNSTLNGYSVSENIAFIAETDNNDQPECLYAIAGRP